MTLKWQLHLCVPGSEAQMPLLLEGYSHDCGRLTGWLKILSCLEPKDVPDVSVQIGIQIH